MCWSMCEVLTDHKGNSGEAGHSTSSRTALRSHSGHVGIDLIRREAKRRGAPGIIAEIEGPLETPVRTHPHGVTCLRGECRVDAPERGTKRTDMRSSRTEPAVHQGRGTSAPETVGRRRWGRGPPGPLARGTESKLAGRGKAARTQTEYASFALVEGGE